MRRGRAALLSVLVVLLGGVLVALSFSVPTAPPAPGAARPVAPGSGYLSAYPAPGTVTVSPLAQLSFRGIPPGELGAVRVEGSRSGVVRTSLLPHRDGQGASLVPSRRFEPGERLTVTTEHAVRGATSGTYTLTVAVPAPRPDVEAPPVQTDRDADGDVVWEHVREYVSAPQLQPPVVEVDGPLAGRGDSGWVTALGVKNGFGQKGPMLVDDAGEPVWFLPLEGVDARDVKVQTLAGRPVLVWWEGLVGTGYGYGEVVVMDTSYTEVGRANMVGYDADFHEVLLTEAGTMLLMAYAPVRMDLSGAGGSQDGMVIDNVVQEIDLATGAILFEWHGLGQVAMAESYTDPPEDADRFDYLHTNSVSVDDDGDLLVSARHTCAVYSVDRETAAIEWRLGGTDSDYALDPDDRFLMQHDVRRSDDGTLTLLDNGGTCGEAERERTRGVALRLDDDAMTAEVVREYTHPDGVFSQSQANMQELPDGQVLIGWGSVPRHTLFDADGDVLLDATIAEDLDVTSYRAHRTRWTGTPRTQPSAAVADGAVHVSWNGATEVATWQVLDAAGQVVAEAARSGFETAVPLPDTASSPLTVRAVDAAGTPLAITTP